MDRDATIARAVEVLRRAEVPFAYLHGSTVSGTATEGSDIDIAAFFGLARARLGEVLLDLPGGVDLLVLDDAGLEMTGRVALHGRLIHELDAPARVEWEATSRKIWFDERPRVERARREFLEAVRAHGRS